MAASGSRLVGRYLLCDAIAEGGTASVHLGRLLGPAGFTRTIAIKQLTPQLARDRDFVAMFLDEARFASRIRHPHVVSPLDAVVLDGELFIVMDYVHGESLFRLLQASQPSPVPVPVAVRVMTEVLLGLDAVHNATDPRGTPLSIVHRDVSPQNILVGQDGLARLVDFGIAKALGRSATTREGHVKGKLGYMAPEQLKLKPIDRRVDVFTAGVVLWEMIVGRRLFASDSPAALVEQLERRSVTPPSQIVRDVPSDLDAIVLCALAYEPEQRFRNAEAMARALTQSCPTAGTLDVGAWVMHWARETLTERQGRVLAIELLDAEAIQQDGAPRPSAAERTLVASIPPVRASERWLAALVVSAACLLLSAVVFAWSVTQRAGSACPPVPTQRAPAAAERAR